MKRLTYLLVRGGTFAGMFAIVAAIFCASAAFASSNEFVIHKFPHKPLPNLAGCFPNGKLIADSLGNLYGAGSCGTSSQGVIFKLTRPVPPSTAWTESVLYSFSIGTDGRFPKGGLVFDAAGNLYGATQSGGTFGWGTVFELSPPAGGVGDWTNTVLYSFQGGTTDGETPLSGIISDASGNLYGVTWQGGIKVGGLCTSGCGIVYELSPPATSGGSWTETILHFFDGTNGGVPIGMLVLDARGDVYGTASSGGKFGDGVVFRLTPPTSGTTWGYKVLHAFSGPDGLSPWGDLAIHGKTVLYGTTQSGGGAGPCVQQGCGTVFQLVPPVVAGGAWTENVIHSFASGTDGAIPRSGVTFDPDGNLYSTTVSGGGAACTFDTAGCGIVFELTPPTSGTTWTETILHAFPSSSADAAEPSGGLIFGAHGVLYGNATGGASSNVQGAVYGVIK